MQTTPVLPRRGGCTSVNFGQQLTYVLVEPPLCATTTATGGGKACGLIYNPTVADEIRSDHNPVLGNREVGKCSYRKAFVGSTRGDCAGSMVGNFGKGGDPHTVKSFDALNQLFQCVCAARPAGNEWVVGQDPAATLPMLCDGFELPHVTGLLGILDDAAAGPPGVERVLFPVVQCPVHRDFDQGR